MINYDKIKVKFKKQFTPHPNIVRQDCYATTAEYAEVYESFYRRNNILCTLQRLRDLVGLPLHVSYPDQPEM